MKGMRKSPPIFSLNNWYNKKGLPERLQFPQSELRPQMICDEEYCFGRGCHLYYAGSQALILTNFKESQNIIAQPYKP
jgi:hypothetical protein